MLKYYNKESKKENHQAFVMLHGYGGNIDSLKPLLNAFSFKENVSFYFLQAPYLMNENKYSWSYETSPGVWERDEPKLLLDDFFKNIIFTKYNSSNVFLLGFSQGAFICFEYGLNMNQQIGGVFPIGGFTRAAPEIHQSQIDTPLIIGHGENDKIVDISCSQKAYEHYVKIKKMNNVKLITYKGGHKIGLKYLKSINLFMEQKNIK